MGVTWANGSSYQYIPELTQYTKPAHETCTKEDMPSQTCILVINQLHNVFLLHCYSVQSPNFTHLFSSFGQQITVVFLFFLNAS